MSRILVKISDDNERVEVTWDGALSQCEVCSWLLYATEAMHDAIHEVAEAEGYTGTLN